MLPVFLEEGVDPGRFDARPGIFHREGEVDGVGILLVLLLLLCPRLSKGLATVRVRNSHLNTHKSAHTQNDAVDTRTTATKLMEIYVRIHKKSLNLYPIMQVLFGVDDCPN